MNFLDKSKVDDILSVVPFGLFTLAAFLLKSDLVQLEDLWPHLSMSAEQHTKEQDEVEELLSRQFKQMEYNYSMIFKSVTNKEAMEAEKKRRMEELNAIQKERAEMPYNFKLWILESFVRINDWSKADEIAGGIY